MIGIDLGKLTDEEREALARLLKRSKDLGMVGLPSWKDETFELAAVDPDVVVESRK